MAFLARVSTWLLWSWKSRSARAELFNDYLRSDRAPRARAMLDLGVEPSTAFAEALRLAPAAWCQKLLGQGASPNVPLGKRSEHPLVLAHASSVEPKEKTRVLLNAGADVNA